MCIYQCLNEGSPANYFHRQYYIQLEEVSESMFGLDEADPITSEVLQALEALDRLLCVMRFHRCYDVANGQAHVANVYWRACQAALALPILSSFECADLYENHDKVRQVFGQLQAALQGVKRIGRIVGPSQSLDLLLPGPSGVLWDLGASWGNKISECDMALCLALSGWSGILVEGDRALKDYIRGQFQDRRNISALLQYVSPGTVAAMLEDAMWNNEHLRGRELDFLQIDLDNGDCDVLQALLEAGHLPRFVRAEFWNVVPPPFAYKQDFEELSGDKSDRYGTVFHWVGRGCSLQALAELLYPLGYALFAALDRWDADFVRRDVAEEMGLQVFPKESSELLWKSTFGTLRWLNNHVPDALLFDPRVLEDPDVPQRDKEVLLRWHLELSSSWNWTLTCPTCDG